MIQIIPNINIILAIKTENIVFAICLAIIITMTYFILPLSIATISTTLKVVFLKEYKYTMQCVCLVTNILLLCFYIVFLTFTILSTTNLLEIQ